MKSRRVFISYAHEDQQLVTQLTSLSWQSTELVWMDRNSIKPGDIWRDEIHKALKRSFCLIFFASNASVRSKEVKLEIDYALDLNKRVIPVLLEKCDLPYQVSNRQHIDLVLRTDENIGVLRQVLTGISPQKAKPNLTNPIAATIVKDVQISNNFYNRVILPNRYVWTSTLASLLIILLAVPFALRTPKPNKANVSFSVDTTFTIVKLDTTPTQAIPETNIKKVTTGRAQNTTSSKPTSNAKRVHNKKVLDPNSERDLQSNLAPTDEIAHSPTPKNLQKQPGNGDGSGNPAGEKGGTGANNNYSFNNYELRGLAGRHIVTYPSLNYGGNETGRIAVGLIVDTNGHVKNAFFDPKGSTSQSIYLKNLALKNATALKFNNAADTSRGLIIFSFVSH